MLLDELAEIIERFKIRGAREAMSGCHMTPN
jgi:hypothetical protein